MNLSQLAYILRARYLVFLIVLLSIFGTVLALSLLLPKSYVASVSVVVDSKGTDPITGMVLPTQFMPTYMATQIDIISSHQVALQVVDRLKLADVPSMREAFHEDTGGRGSLRDWLADKLLVDLDVKPSRESSIVDIQFEGADPHYAAEMANAFAEAYVKVGLQLSAEPAKRQAQWFGQQVQNLRDTLAAAQEKLAAFQREQGFVSGDERLDIETARLGEIAQQLVAAQTATYDAQTRVQQMNEISRKGRLQELPDILGNPLLQNLKAELVRAEGKFAQVAKRYDHNHPEHRAAAAELQMFRDKLAVEINTTKGSVQQNAHLAEQREKEIQSALDQQKARILALKNERNQYDVMTREVENAQRAYDTAVQRAEQVQLESKLDESRIAILNPAVPPAKPAKPRVLLNSILALFLGTILGACGAVLAELRDRRVRSSDDLATQLGVPVLGELPLFAKTVAGQGGLLLEHQ